MITQLTQTVLLEIALYLKSWKFWLVALLVNAYIWTAFFLAGQVMSGVAQMLLPMLIFLAVETATRDNKEDFSEIIGVLPYNNLYLLGGRAFAILLLLIFLGIELLLTMFLTQYTEMPIYISWSAGEAFLIKYLVVCINVIGVTFFAASLTRNTVRLYCILFFWWLTGVFLASNTGTLFPAWTALPNAVFIYGFGGNPSEIAGLFPYEQSIKIVIFFQVSCSMLLFSGAVLLEQARRGSEGTIIRTCWSQAFPAVAAIMIVFYMVWQGCGLSADTKIMSASAARGSVLPAAAVEQPVTLRGYNLHITLDSEAHHLAAKAQVALQASQNAPPSALEFTLREYLHVQQVIDVSTGEALSWQQEGPYVTVQPPGSFAAAGLLTVEISYAGTIWEWSEDFFGQPAGLVNFVAEPFTCLRGGQAWYPLVGRQPLYATTNYTLPWSEQPRQLAQPRLVSHAAVPIQLTIDGSEAVTMISNLDFISKQQAGQRQRYQFSSPACRAVFILAGRYEHIPGPVTDSGGMIDIYNFPGHQKNLQDISYKYAQVLDYYEHLVPRKTSTAFDGSGKRYILFETPRFLAYDSLMRANNLGFIDAIPVTEAIAVTKALQSPWWSQSASRSLSEARLLNLWWPNCFSETNGDIADGLALYMYTLYKEHRYGKKAYQDAREYWLAYHDGTPDNEEMLSRRGRIVRTVFLLMDTIRDSSLGDEGVKQFLRAVHDGYQDKGTIEPADMTAALEQIGALPKGDGLRQDNNSVEAKYRDKINSLQYFLTNPSENKLSSTLMVKLNWDFGAEVKLFKVK